MTDKRLLTKDEASEFLGITPRTLARWTADGRVPAVRVGPRCVRYDTQDLERFIEANKSTGPGDAPEQLKPVYERTRKARPAETDPRKPFPKWLQDQIDAEQERKKNAVGQGGEP